MAFSSSYAYTRLGAETSSRTTRPRRLRLLVLGGFFLFVALSTLYALDVHLPEWSPQVWHGMWENVYHHQLYVPIAPNTPHLPRARRHYPTDECLEISLAQGGRCDQKGYGLADKPKIDIVWSWVNSTDPVWRRANAYMEAKREGKDLTHDDLVRVDESSEGFRFDNYDELRHSMRSALRAFGNEARRFTLLAADFPMQPEYPASIEPSEADAWRLGQVPSWLPHPVRGHGNRDMLWLPSKKDKNVGDAHWNSAKDGSGVELAVLHHSTYFNPYVGSNFCSFCIESHLPNLRGVADVFIYLNDDMYFLRDHVVADYWSAPWGLVMRPQKHIPVPATPDMKPINGEWQPLRHTNHIISRRFGAMTRPYMTHQPKSGTITLWREFSAMFTVEFQRTQLRQFRNIYFEDPADKNSDRLKDLPWPFNLDPEVNTEGRGNGSMNKADVHTTFGLGHFVIERHREMLLWSWAVARMGDVDGHFDATAAWKAVGGTDDIDMVRVQDWDYGKPNESRDSRRGGAVDDALNAAGFISRKTADIIWVSSDGYRFYDWRTEWKEEDSELLDKDKDEICLIRRAECFPNIGLSASDAFKNIAFKHPRCGDCVVQALIRASGRLGFGAFLPSGDRAVKVSPAKLARVLPLDSTWEKTDFSLRGVLEAGVPDAIREEAEKVPSTSEPAEPVLLRRWILRALDRYRHSHAISSSKFLVVRDVKEAERVVAQVDQDLATTACINDNVMHPHDMYEDEGITEGQKVQQILHEWQSRRWPDVPAWEMQ